MTTVRTVPFVLVCAAVVAWSSLADAKVLKMGTIAPEGTRYMKDIEGLSRDIEELSDGALRLKWYPGGALGEEDDMADLVKEGKLDGAGFTDVGLSYLVPEMLVWMFPGLFESYGEVDYLEKQFREKYEKLFEDHGVVLLLWADIGFLHVFSNEPIGSLEDLRKHAMWVRKDDAASRYAADLLEVESEPGSLAYLAKGLKAGTIDAWHYPPMGAVAFGLHPYAKHMSEVKYRYMVGALVLRKESWEGLTKSEQRLIRSVAEKWQTKLLRGWRKQNDTAVVAMEKQGLKVTKMSDEARETFYRAAADARAAFAKKFGVEDLMREFTDTIREFRDLQKD